MFLTARSFAQNAFRLGRMVIPLSIGVILFSGCAKRDETYLTVQMCVHDQEGVKHLKDMMRAVADAGNLQFVDGSSETSENLKATGADKALKRDPALAINVGIKGTGGTFVMGGNLGLPPYQVALGFGTGSDPAKAHQLSDHLVRLLSAKWDVETVPQGKGVFPMESCENGARGMSGSPNPSKAR